MANPGMIDLDIIRLFLLVWGGGALAARLVYARRARVRKAQPGVDQTPPHPLAVLAMSAWFGMVGLILIFPRTVEAQLIDMPLVKYGQIAGLTVLTFGLWLLIRAHQALGEFYGVKLYIKQNHYVIDAGPYAYVRHPMYTTYLTWFAAMTLIVPHYIPAAVFIMGTCGFYRMAKGEERMLSQALGEPYRKYRQRTGMFVPGL